jgi:hypothetical protein
MVTIAEVEGLRKCEGARAWLTVKTGGREMRETPKNPTGKVPDWRRKMRSKFRT